ncbi:hypothetical protein CR513_09796, partial [Mucuna pruriens]
MGEKELIITTPMPEEYIEGDEETLEASFQSLEVEGIARLERGHKHRSRRPSRRRTVDRQRKAEIRGPTKDLESVNLGGEIEGREVRIGKQIPPDLRAKLIELLKEYTDIFAWSYQDMPGLDRKIVEHKVPLLPGSTPIRQQL